MESAWIIGRLRREVEISEQLGQSPANQLSVFTAEPGLIDPKPSTARSQALAAKSRAMENGANGKRRLLRLIHTSAPSSSSGGAAAKRRRGDPNATSLPPPAVVHDICAPPRRRPKCEQKPSPNFSAIGQPVGPASFYLSHSLFFVEICSHPENPFHTLPPKRRPECETGTAR